MNAFPHQAEISALNRKVAAKDPTDSILDWFEKQGLDSLVINELDNLAAKIVTIGGKILQIGKIILVKAWEFCKLHPEICIGTALGLALQSMLSSIPFIGWLLSPVLALLPAIGFAVGLLASRHPLKESWQAAKDFFRLLIEFIREARAHFTNPES